MKFKDLFYISIIFSLFGWINRDAEKTALLDSLFSLENQPLEVTIRELTPKESRSILKYTQLN